MKDVAKFNYIYIIIRDNKYSQQNKRQLHSTEGGFKLHQKFMYFMYLSWCV